MCAALPYSVHRDDMAMLAASFAAAQCTSRRSGGMAGRVHETATVEQGPPVGRESDRRARVSTFTVATARAHGGAARPITLAAARVSDCTGEIFSLLSIYPLHSNIKGMLCRKLVRRMRKNEFKARC